MSSDRDRMELVLTGIGPVSAIGIGRAAWRHGLAADGAGVSPPSQRTGEHPTVAVRDFDLSAILPSRKTYLDRASEFVLAAGYLALTDAGITQGEVDRWRAGVVVGSSFGCLATMQTYTGALHQKGARLANPLLFSHMYVNTPASLLAIEFGLGGHHGTFTGDDAGAQALDAAVEAMQCGRADMLLAVGVDVISEPLLHALCADGSLGDNPLGEGACALVLETAASAAARGVAGHPLSDPRADSTPVRALLGHTFAAEPFFALARRIAAVTVNSD